MSRFVIDVVIWNKLEQLLPAPKGWHGKDDRLFLEAVWLFCVSVGSRTQATSGL
jgi:hypothetical protein